MLEFRYCKKELDEIVLKEDDFFLHLERMDEGHIWIGLTRKEFNVHLNVMENVAHWHINTEFTKQELDLVGELTYNQIIQQRVDSLPVLDGIIHYGPFKVIGGLTNLTFFSSDYFQLNKESDNSWSCSVCYGITSFEFCFRNTDNKPLDIVKR